MHKELRTITAREKMLMGMPSIASQLPVKFKNGMRWDDFAGECNICEKNIDNESIRGLVTVVNDTTATLEAVGICQRCNVATAFHCRFHGDATMSWLGANGAWYRTKKPSRLSRAYIKLLETLKDLKLLII